MTDFSDVFIELFYGEGAWLGLILILSICLIIGRLNKASAWVMAIILMFIGIQYLTHASMDFTSNFAWSGVICFACMTILIWQGIKLKK